jgi:hypothetical protein
MREKKAPQGALLRARNKLTRVFRMPVDATMMLPFRGS